MNPKLTQQQEDEIEWRYRYEERLAIMCGNGQLNDRQIQIAKLEADEAIKSLRDRSRLIRNDR